jgi:hypothetical protein
VAGSDPLLAGAGGTSTMAAQDMGGGVLMCGPHGIVPGFKPNQSGSKPFKQN